MRNVTFEELVEHAQMELERIGDVGRLYKQMKRLFSNDSAKIFKAILLAKKSFVN